MYSNGWINAKLYYPLAVVIDLSVMYDLTDICWFDVEDQGVLTVAYRDADAWKTVFRGPLIEYNKWTTRKVAAATRVFAFDIRKSLLANCGGGTLWQGSGYPAGYTGAERASDGVDGFVHRRERIR